MNILINNPNTDQEITETIRKSAIKFVNVEYTVDCQSAPGGPSFIATYEHQMQSVNGMIRLIRQNEEKLKPVVGICEASIKLASMLGHKYSIISPVDHSITNKEAMVHKYHLDGMLSSVRSPLLQDKNMPEVDKFIRSCFIVWNK